MKIFHSDTRIFQILDKVVDLAVINLLWILCSLPLITVGASTSAMYSLTLKMVKNEEGNIVKSFFCDWKKYARQSSLVFLIITASIVFLGLDLWAALYMNNLYGRILAVAIISVIYFVLAVASYIFPVIVTRQADNKKVFQYAFYYAMKNGVNSFLIMLLNSLPLLLICLKTQFFFKSLVFWIIIGFSGVAYLNSLYIRRCFDNVKLEK